jgi:hypothetical protein
MCRAGIMGIDNLCLGMHAVVIHNFCPHDHEFEVSSEDIENLHDLIKKLSKR